jgi:hypothetical protein
MQISELTTNFVADLGRYSGNRLKRPDDLAVLLEIARRRSDQDVFDRLVFLAKFAVKSRKIMERIGVGAEGYDKLSAELAPSLAEICSLLAVLVDSQPGSGGSQFKQNYLANTPDAVGNLFDLLSDLTWYKNWTIDHRDWKLT